MPAWVIEIFKSNYKAFAANPLLFVLAFVAGAFIGFLFSKLPSLASPAPLLQQDTYPS